MQLWISSLNDYYWFIDGDDARDNNEWDDDVLSVNNDDNSQKEIALEVWDVVVFYRFWAYIIIFVHF